MEPLSIFGLIASIFTGILGLINGSETNRTNQQIAAQTNRANMAINQSQLAHADKAAEEADTRTRALFDDLYSPAAKMAQYKAAGLNPALMYASQGAMGTTTQGSQASTPAAIGMQSIPMQRLLGLDNASTFQDIGLKMAETNLKKAQTQNEIADLPIKEQMVAQIKKNIEESQSKIDLNYQKIEESIANIGNINAQKELNEQMKKLKEAETAITNVDLITRGEINQATLNQLKEKTKLFQAQAQEAIAAANKYNWEAKEIKDTLALKIEQMEYGILQTIANTQQLNASTRKLDSETWLNQLQAQPQQALQNWLNQFSKNNPGLAPAMYEEIKSGLSEILGIVGDVFRVISKVK